MKIYEKKKFFFFTWKFVMKNLSWKLYEPWPAELYAMNVAVVHTYEWVGGVSILLYIPYAK
jgi:hypothetical protein